MIKALIGYGGHAKEVMMQMNLKLVCFVDDPYVTEDTKPLSEFDPSLYEVMIAIGDCKIRFDIFNKLPKNTKFFTWIHNTAIIGENVEIGHGSFIGAYSILTTNIKIGRHSIINRANHIGHDCQIGDYFSMMPGAIVSGNAKISNFVYIGTNSSIREKIEICDNVKIGLNSEVVSNINEPGVYAGLPAKKIK